MGARRRRNGVEGKDDRRRPKRPQAVVTRCAWCGRVARGDAWRHAGTADLAIAELEAHALVTHGICPTCFAQFAPGREYPG